MRSENRARRECDEERAKTLKSVRKQFLEGDPTASARALALGSKNKARRANFDGNFFEPNGKA